MAARFRTISREDSFNPFIHEPLPGGTRSAPHRAGPRPSYHFSSGHFSDFQASLLKNMAVELQAHPHSRQCAPVNDGQQWQTASRSSISNSAQRVMPSCTWCVSADTNVTTRRVNDGNTAGSTDCSVDSSESAHALSSGNGNSPQAARYRFSMARGRSDMPLQICRRRPA